MRQAVQAAYDEGMTEQEVVYLAKLVAAAETARQRDEAMRSLYGKDSA